MLIAGLGNPGRRYAGTRHNVGFDLVDLLAARWGAEPRTGDRLHELWLAEFDARDVYLMKPLSYMNRSGVPILRFLWERGLGVGDLLAVVDDMALEVGRFRFRSRGSAGGHKGLTSIEECLGTREYSRLRMGIGPAPEAASWVDFVLTTFSEDERNTLDETMLRAAEGVETLLREGIDKAMSRHNC